MASSSKQGKRCVLVTGAGGLIGGALCAALEDRGYTPLRLDLDEADADYVCNLTHPESIRNTLERIEDDHGKRLHAVVHLAAYYDFSGEDNPLYKTLNVDANRYLLEGLAGAGMEVGRFVYSSTMLVHAATEPGIPITECSPLRAKWAYPISKLEAEKEIESTVRRLAGRGMDIPVSILRLAGLYHDYCGSPTLAHQIQRIYEKQLTSNFYAGDPATGQSFVHLDDAIAALVLAVDKADELPDWHVALVGEPDVMSYQALNNAISEKLFGEPLPVTELPEGAAKAGARLQRMAEQVVPDSLDNGEEPFIRPFMIDLAEDHYELDISRARESLGFEPTHRLGDDLPGIVQRLVDDPREFYARNKLEPPHWMTRFPDGEDPNAWRAAVLEEEAGEHRSFLWTHFATMALGAWLMAAPASIAVDDARMIWSDLLAGAGIVVFSLIALNRELRWSRLVTAVLGLWVAAAPVLFWTPNAAAYLNGTLVGILVTCFALAARPVIGPNLAARADTSVIPDGWDYSPSSWLQRLPIVVLAFVGLFVSRYLAAFQLGQTDTVWDPFFGDGTERIITSFISHAWPVSDAGLGGYVYLLEIIAGIVGTQRRWRTMPWLTLFFGFLIVPLGAVSIYFIIVQPILIGTWCSLCLLAAAAMVLQIPYSFDEIFASLQFVARRHRAGASVLRVLLTGDAQQPPPAGENASIRPGEVPEPRILTERPRRWLREICFGGLSVPWTLGVSALLGILLMCTRLLVDTEGALANSDHLLGSLVVVVSVSALAEVARPLRFANAMLGLGLIGAPFLFEGGSLWSGVLDVAVGIVLIVLSIPRGSIVNRYGGLDRYLV